jgi:hypothetical protein
MMRSWVTILKRFVKIQTINLAGLTGMMNKAQQTSPASSRAIVDAFDVLKTFCIP